MTIFLIPILSLFFKCRAEFLMISFFFFLKEVYFPFSFGKVNMIFLYFDILSVLIVLLSCWITILMLISLSESKLELPILLLFLNLSCYFFAGKKMMFFIFFESSLFPIFFMILKWGYQPERVKAVFFFCIYTIFFSIPFLLSLFFLETEVFFLNNNKMTEIWSFFLMVVLLVKLPFFFTHYWLPMAHVEAPVVGSMILAGVLLKMGGYGMFRIMIFLKKNSKVLFFFLSVSLIGTIITTIICLFSQDMKQLIAYSSVSHMNFMIYSMMEGSVASMKASFMMMIVHGLSSSCLFFLSDVIYKRTNSRSLIVSKGLLNLFPLSAFWMFTTMVSSSGVPPTLGSLSEVMIASSIFFKFPLQGFLLVIYFFFSFFYMFYFYYSIVHGNSMKNLYFTPMNVKESYILFMHSFVSLIIIFLSDLFTL